MLIWMTYLWLVTWKPSQDLKADSPNLPEITTRLFCFVVLCCVCTGWFLSLHDGCCIKAMWRRLSVWYTMLPKLTKHLLQMSYSTQRSVWSSRLQSYCTHNAIFNNFLMFCFVFLHFFFQKVKGENQRKYSYMDFMHIPNLRNTVIVGFFLW